MWIRSEVRNAIRVLEIDWDLLDGMIADGNLSQVRMEIRRAYWRIAFRTHPDRMGNDEGRSELHKAQRARDFLLKVDDLSFFRKPALDDGMVQFATEFAMDLIDTMFFGDLVNDVSKGDNDDSVDEDS